MPAGQPFANSERGLYSEKVASKFERNFERIVGRNYATGTLSVDRRTVPPSTNEIRTSSIVTATLSPISKRKRTKFCSNER